MTRTGRVLLAAAATATATTVAVAQTLPPIKKIVVLMQENRCVLTDLDEPPPPYLC